MPLKYNAMPNKITFSFWNIDSLRFSFFGIFQSGAQLEKSFKSLKFGRKHYNVISFENF